MKRVKGNIWSDRYVYGIDYGDNFMCMHAQWCLTLCDPKNCSLTSKLIKLYTINMQHFLYQPYLNEVASKKSPQHATIKYIALKAKDALNPHTCGQSVYDKGGKTIQWRKDSLFNKWCWGNWTPTYRRMKLEHPLT